MAYRAYYALQGQNLTHPVTGQPIHAIFGFLRMFVRTLLDYRPERTAVVWDSPGKSFRGDLFGDYKATRKPMPEDLRPQIDEIKELLHSAGFANLEAPNFEADDLIGALAARFGKKSRVLLITGDKDCYQLLNKNVTMLRGAKGVTEFTEITPDWVQTELGVSVKQIPDYMGLVGDSSDNIPGAKGVGPKSATKLLEDYKNLEGLYKHLNSVKPDGLRKKLEESRDLVFLSRDLATIRCDVKEALEVDDETLRTPDLFAAQTLQAFRREGYNAVYNELLKAKNKAEEAASAPAGGKKKKGKAAAAPEKTRSIDVNDAANFAEAQAAGAVQYALVSDLAGLKACLESLEAALGKERILAVDTETTSEEPVRARLVGVSLAAHPGQAWYISLPPGDGLFADAGLTLDEARPLLKAFLERSDLKITGQNIKYDMIVLRRHGIELQQLYFDTMIASYLCNPNVRRHNLDDMALDILGYDTIKFEDVVGSGRNKKTMDQVAPDAIRDYACEDADVVLRLHAKLAPLLAEKKLETVNTDIELALIPALVDMEIAGVAIDEKYFAKLSKEYAKNIETLEKNIYKAVGYEFNINSTRELQKILFEDLQLPHGRKTKTGYSTDQTVLEELRGLHPLVDDILEHRKFSKLRSTYIDALPALVHPETGRIHTSFNQTIAATGRLSSNEPNLQNIPIREDAGRAIRRGFVPAAGAELLSLDYSQIELRIMAHYSGDPALIETFTRSDIDVHARTASSLFGVKEADVTPDMRSRAKAVNFSIIYGVTEFGLGRNLNISREEARGYIDRFFAQYPGVRRYMDETIAFAEKHGYVQTLTGRQRQIPEINSSNRFRREGAQRTAINTPIQGASADIIKIAMIRIHADMQKKKLRSRMILQVHDELLFDVYPEEKDAVLKIARERMENAMDLRTPLRVDYRFGKNWDEAH